MSRVPDNKAVTHKRTLFFAKRQATVNYYADFVPAPKNSSTTNESIYYLYETKNTTAIYKHGVNSASPSSQGRVQGKRKKLLSPLSNVDDDDHSTIAARDVAATNAREQFVPLFVQKTFRFSARVRPIPWFKCSQLPSASRWKPLLRDSYNHYG